MRSVQSSLDRVSNTAWLRQVEGVLSSKWTTTRLSYKEFYRLMKTHQISAPSNDNKNLNNDNNDLSREEGLLLELLCVASPTLLRMTKDACLERVSFPGNRIQELERLGRQQQTTHAKRREILGAIRKSQRVDARRNQEAAVMAIHQSRFLEETTKKRKEIRIRFADALWSHTRSILDRAMASSPPNRRTKRPCAMTLRDVQGCFGQHFDNHDKNQLFTALQELHHLAPEWILLPPSGKHFSPDTTVWIQPINHYQQVRSRLQQQQQQQQQQQGGGEISSTKKKDATTTTTTTRPKHTSKTRKVSLSSQEDVPAPKKQRLSAQAPKRYHDNNNNDDDNDFILPIRKKRKGLRINEHLIMTDADHGGGEIIEPTGESPRGLKRLFFQMNAGKRI